jgi:hypothetical protein
MFGEPLPSEERVQLVEEQEELDRHGSDFSEGW